MTASNNSAPTLGDLDWEPATQRPDLLAARVADNVSGLPAFVAEINPALADTAAFARAYDIPLAHGANCVIIRGDRAGVTTTAAVVIRGCDRADINNVVRRHLGLRKASFLALDQATSLTGMEYGGITPIGLPAEWPVLIDEAVAESGWLVIGSGLRSSKLAIVGSELTTLSGAQVLALTNT